MRRINAIVRWLVGAPDREDVRLGLLMRYRVGSLGRSLQQPLVAALTRARWSILLRIERAESDARHMRSLVRIYPERSPRSFAALRARFVGWLAARAGVGFHPGRYEGNDSRLMAEWLDTHPEYADETTGDVEWVGYFALFAGGGFPWGDGNYILRTGSQGFVDIESFPTEAAARAAFEVIDRDFAAVAQDLYDEPFADDPDGWGEREGFVLPYDPDDDSTKTPERGYGSESESRLMDGDR